MADARSHAVLMDRVYRRQRHIYDATRKFYLLGRDRLIDQLAVPEGGSVLEIACGTGRNLAAIGRRFPGAELYGVDISAEMLTSARQTLGAQARLAQGDATDFDAAASFGVAHFDRVVVSYAVSMIPRWEAALAEAWRLTAPDGTLAIVDFGTMARLPSWSRRTQTAWLARFHVSPRPELADVCAQIAADGGTLSLQPVFRDYALVALIRRTG